MSGGKTKVQYDLNQNLYTVEVTNRFKGLDLRFWYTVIVNAMMAIIAFTDCMESQTGRNEIDFKTRIWSNSQPVQFVFDNLERLVS